jgi:hypothetical protein
MNVLKALIITGIFAGTAGVSAQTMIPLEKFEVPADFFLVATGRMRTQIQAAEYCTNLGRRLPNREEAIAIYQSTLNPATGQTSLASVAQVDTDKQDGSFWTAEKQGWTACPVGLFVNPPTDKTSYTLKSTCARKARLLTICVKY